MLCTNLHNVVRSSVSPVKTAYAVESYCALLTPPPCLYGMHDVTRALEVLHSFCNRKVLATSTAEQYRAMLTLATRDLLEPIVDLLWCRLAVLHELPLDTMPADFALRVKDLERYLPPHVTDNMWQLRRAGEDLAGEPPGPRQLDRLLTALQRLRELFEDVHEVMSTSTRLHAAPAAELHCLPDYYITSPPLSADSVESPPPVRTYQPEGPSTYSLFGGRNTWPFAPGTAGPTMSSAQCDEHTRRVAAFGPPGGPVSLQGSSSYPTLPSFVRYSHPGSPSHSHALSSNHSLDSPGTLTPTSPSPPLSTRASRTSSLEGGDHRRAVGADLLGSPRYPPYGAYDLKHDVVSVMASLDLNGPCPGESSDWQESPVRYKTAMCKRVVDGQKCRYSKACGFAHGEAEKDRYTRLHLATIRCTFGPKCHNPSCGRAHTPQEQRLAIKIYNHAVDRGRGAPLK
eukprot:comp24204_c0_seq1/m.44457 comp24204_c0_seq1/g.44457  ORF comp24204_c0_seq1/g.44457 comp24204_c0_seq1/m.44457 type:complete len:456 (-) comp24204_c0_seq1:691-2058(-)